MTLADHSASLDFRNTLESDRLRYDTHILRRLLTEGAWPVRTIPAVDGRAGRSAPVHPPQCYGGPAAPEEDDHGTTGPGRGPLSRCLVVRGPL
jgi:hypothetical protein